MTTFKEAMRKKEERLRKNYEAINKLGTCIYCGKQNNDGSNCEACRVKAMVAMNKVEIFDLNIINTKIPIGQPSIKPMEDFLS